MGLAMRGGAVLDGTDIAALLISKRSYLLRVGDVILGLNVVIFLAAAFFLGVDPALYSILTYISASKTLDFLLHGIEQYHAITIISEQSEAIRKAITGELGRGVTVYKGRGGMAGADREILLCVVTRPEIGKVMEIVQDRDPTAFVTLHPFPEAKEAPAEDARALSPRDCARGSQNAEGKGTRKKEPQGRGYKTREV